MTILYSSNGDTIKGKQIIDVITCNSKPIGYKDYIYLLIPYTNE